MLRAWLSFAYAVKAHPLSSPRCSGAFVDATSWASHYLNVKRTVLVELRGRKRGPNGRIIREYQTGGYFTVLSWRDSQHHPVSYRVRFQLGSRVFSTSEESREQKPETRREDSWRPFPKLGSGVAGETRAGDDPGRFRSNQRLMWRVRRRHRVDPRASLRGS